MIETIRIGHLLRETATSPYRHLVTRPTGAAVRNRPVDQPRPRLSGSPLEHAAQALAALAQGLVHLRMLDDIVERDIGRSPADRLDGQRPVVWQLRWRAGLWQQRRGRRRA